MNIFVLDPDPVIAASYHADQHLHKMILESAQMISSAMIQRKHTHNFPPNFFYKLSYPKHPCTIWTSASNHNILWLCELALALEDIRFSVHNCPEHSSIPLVKATKDYFQEDTYGKSSWK